MAGREPLSSDPIFISRASSSSSRDTTWGLMDDGWLNKILCDAALKLHAEGLVTDGNPRSWHSRTTCEHAGVDSLLVEAFMGHEFGIRLRYDHRSEVYPEEIAKKYLKIEQTVSLHQRKRS